MKRGRNAGPGVTWAGVVIKLDNGETVALEFDGTRQFLTADVIRNTHDNYQITIQGRGRMWRDGAQRYAEPVRSELGAAPVAIEEEVIGG